MDSHECESRDDWGEWITQATNEDAQDMRSRPWKRFQTNDTATCDDEEKVGAEIDNKVESKKDNEVQVYHMDDFYAAATS